MKITTNTLFKDNPIPKIPPDWFWLFQSWVLKQAVNPFSRRVRMFWLLLYTCQQNGGGWAGDTKALASHQLFRPFPDKGVLGSEDGEQDMLVLMPHGNWRWATFSQLAHQLTFCRRKTTVRTLPGFPIPLCKPPVDFLMAEFLGNPAPTSPSASWQSCWFGQQPSGHPSPSLDTHPSEEEGELTSDKELVQLAGHSLNFFARPFVEKPSANQWWYCAEFSSPQFETNKNYPIVFLSSAYQRATLKRAVFSQNATGFQLNPVTCPLGRASLPTNRFSIIEAEAFLLRHLPKMKDVHIMWDCGSLWGVAKLQTTF